MSSARIDPDAEERRLAEDARRERNWKRWGPYLSERQWGTVREDYSPDGRCWESFPHDHARSRAYRWGEDGLLGICDRQCRLCFAVALWNEHDPILKERLFGLTNGEGNHGEDVKECYFYLDSTPTHSYLKGLYRYPQAAYPYAWLVEEARRRGPHDPEFELLDTGVLSERRYFDVVAEYAKAGPNDLLIRLRATNRGPEPARLHLLPTLWFRNTWSWGRRGEGYSRKPVLRASGPGRVDAEHETLGRFTLHVAPGRDGPAPLLFTENETNHGRLMRAWDDPTPRKDAFHRYLINDHRDAVAAEAIGTKMSVHHALELAPGEEQRVELRLCAEPEAPEEPFGPAFDEPFERRIAEADAFYARRVPGELADDACTVTRQSFAGLLWTKQFYHLDVRAWIDGDPAQPPPPSGRREGRNRDWQHLYNRDVLSMPDKWEYPWYAAWDLAFHTVPLADVDPDFAKEQLLLLLREWYMHPNGQIPAYEFEFSDVNPPVHAWAAWTVYTGGEKRDLEFLARVFHKLLLNFTWWVNRKDPSGRNLFAGGFLGLDNIGVFDRSRPLPTGGHLEQADGTAWMAFYCATMLTIALELASHDATYADVASKFFEHFVAIADATNRFGGTGLWDESDGFYYDRVLIDGTAVPLKVRSAVGLIPLIAVEILEEEPIRRLPGFRKRMEWFLEHRPDLSHQICWMEPGASHRDRLLAIPSRERLERILRYLFDEQEFLSPFGIRSLSRVHRDRPFVFGEGHRVDYQPGESDTALFGGNSNWRGPIWLPINYLLVEALERYDRFYGDRLTVECPTGSGRHMRLGEAAREIARRVSRLFLRGDDGRRPHHGPEPLYADDPDWRELVLFYEYFHAETGRGLGASHQTGWTALASRFLKVAAEDRPDAAGAAPGGATARG